MNDLTDYADYHGPRGLMLPTRCVVCDEPSVREVVDIDPPRIVVSYRCGAMLDASYPDGVKQQTTVKHGCRKIVAMSLEALETVDGR